MKFLRTIFLFLLFISITNNVKANDIDRDRKFYRLMKSDVMLDYLDKALAEKIPTHIQQRYGQLNPEFSYFSHPESNAAITLVGLLFVTPLAAKTAAAVAGTGPLLGLVSLIAAPLYLSHLKVDGAIEATFNTDVLAYVINPIVRRYEVSADSVRNFYIRRLEYHFEFNNMSGSCLVYFGYDFLQRSLEYELDQCVLNNGIIGETIPQKEEGRVRIGIEGADVFDHIQGQTQVVATGSIPLDLEN